LDPMPIDIHPGPMEGSLGLPADVEPIRRLRKELRLASGRTLDRPSSRPVRDKDDEK